MKAKLIKQKENHKALILNDMLSFIKEVKRI